MLTIRPKQLDVLSEPHLKAFEDRMVTHLKELFTNQTERLGEPKLREVIRHGINRAAVYGISIECDVCKYIDLMMVWGADFDQDQKLPWAGQILRTRNDPSLKTSVLDETAKKKMQEK